MKIVAFLQNQWFKNPERHRAFAEKYPELREEMIKRFLFAGCRTGQKLQSVLGADLCGEIIWEETSREIGGHANSIFPPDREHINAVCLKHNPDIVLAFGKQASEALKARNGFEFLICGPHPVARYEGTVDLLRFMRKRIDHYRNQYAKGYRGEYLELSNA